MIRACALVLAVAVAGCASQAADRAAQDDVRKAGSTLPRVVSINPCVDAVLMQVAEPGQIAAISHYSQDPRATSIPLEQARRFAATSGTAEEVVAQAPDIVIAGAHVAPATIAALHRMHIRLVQIGVPESIAESQEQIRTIAAAVHQRQRGERLVARIDAAVFGDAFCVHLAVWAEGAGECDLDGGDFGGVSGLWCVAGRARRSRRWCR